jgi:uncharacterized protein YbjT (DUF2867 family)
MRKVLVAGATGGCGRLIVHRLIQLGIPVRALTRDSSRAPALAANEVAVGTALAPEDCRRAVEGCDEVICTLGDHAVPADRPIVDGEGIINLAEAAVRAGATRFVVVSSLGVGDSWGTIPAFVRWWFRRAGLVPILEAKARSEEWLRASPLRWTILRPGLLTNFQMRAEPVVLPASGLAPGISTRQGVADVAVRCLDSAGTVNQVFTVVDGWLRSWVRGTPIRLDVPWVRWHSRGWRAGDGGRPTSAAIL